MPANTQENKRLFNQAILERNLNYIKKRDLTKKIGEKIEREFLSRAYLIVNNGFNQLNKDYNALISGSQEIDFELHNIIGCHRIKILKMFQNLQNEIKKM